MLPTSVLKHEQVKKIITSIDLNSSEGIRNRALIELMYSSGVRVGEIVRIRVEDIDLNGRVMKVFGKGNKERMVPLGKTATDVLEEYISGARNFLNSNNLKNLFVNSSGNPLTIHRIQKIVSDLAENGGITDIRVTPHTFRRSCATEMIRNNANIYHVKDLLGHESLSTLKHYTKLTINDLKETHAKFHPREKDT